MPKYHLLTAPRSLAAALLLSLVVGCSGGGRDEETAAIDGKVTYKGTAVPAGSGLLVEDKAKGISMKFAIGADGAYSVPETAELPAGTFTVAVTPPSGDGTPSSEADYDKMMGGADAAQPAAPEKVDYVVPEKFRDTKTSEKTIEAKPGTQTIDIDFGA